MSIDMAADTPRKSKRAKSDKTQHSHSEKKRKRDQQDSPHTSKKQRATETPAPVKESPAAVEASPFHHQTSSLYLPLSPLLQRHPLEGLCAEHLSPLLLQYYPPLGGVILSYSNPRMSERPFGNDGANTKCLSIDEYAVSWTWVTADFLVLKPSRGVELVGHVNLQNEGHVAVVCWNLFSASIARERLPKEWRWVPAGAENDAEEADAESTPADEGGGYYVDATGAKVEGEIKFRVKEIETGFDRERSFLTIVGTMLSLAQEEALAKEEAQSGAHANAAGHRLGGAKALGSTSLRAPTENTGIET